LYRLYWSAGMDVGLHVVVWLLARWLPGLCTRLFYGRVLPVLVPRGWKVVDRSDRQLTMQHELFRHIEIEVFVTRSRLAEAIALAVWLLRHAGGEAVDPPDRVRERLSIEERKRLDAVKGRYLHHYPICIRKVLPDDTLISMASGGDEPYCALSFISYAHPCTRDAYFQFARSITTSI